MKITSNTNLQPLVSSKPLNPSPDSDLLPRTTSRRSPRRKSRNPGGGVRLKRDGAPAGKRSRPETPLRRWKVHNYRETTTTNVSTQDGQNLPEFRQKTARKARKGRDVSVSARKLGAGLWRLQLPEVPTNVGGWPEKDRSGFQSTSGHLRAGYVTHHNSKSYGANTKDLAQSPHSISGPRNGFFCKLEPSLHFSNSAMEGATKWDPACCKMVDETQQLYGHSIPLDQQAGVVAKVSALEVELEQARGRIHELETERQSSKKKLEHFLKKLSEERAIWRSREHEKIRAIIDDVKADLSRERKNRQRMEIVNSKLVNELSEAKLSARRFMQDFEKERKARELIEEVCDELAKEIGEDKAEVEALKRESLKLRDEVEDERKMLQMAEVWREERVQMKLIDAKVTLEEKYSQMNKQIAELEMFLSSKSAITNTEEMRKAELLRQAAASVNIKDITEFTYEPSNPEDIYSIFEDVNFGESNEREIEDFGVYSPASHASKVRNISPKGNIYDKEGIPKYRNAYVSENGDIEDDDDSGWETVSRVDEQGSSYSPDGSDPSVNKIRRDSNISGSEISEISSSISRLWRSLPRKGEKYKIIEVEGNNARLSNGGRLSNGAITSPDRATGKGSGLSPPDSTGQWSSPDSGNPQINRGMKGCIEWPRSGSQKHSLKAKLLEARVETQKIQLRQVLKQKI